MNKLIITLAVSALAICTFAQGIPQPKAVREADALDIMGTILFKPNQAFGEGLFFDNRECKERRLANMPTRALAF